MILIELFLTFFKIGAFTFGGGYAMLPLVQEEVIKRGWMSAEQLVNFIAVSESTPGPFAVNTSTYIGAEIAGLKGAFCATAGVVMPSFIIILIVARFFMSFCENRYVNGCMSGLRPAVVAMIASAVISVGKPVFVPFGISSLVIFALSLVLVFKKIHPIIIILTAAVLGLAAGYMGIC